MVVTFVSIMSHGVCRSHLQSLNPEFWLSIFSNDKLFIKIGSSVLTEQLLLTNIANFLSCLHLCEVIIFVKSTWHSWFPFLRLIRSLVVMADKLSFINQKLFVWGILLINLRHIYVIDMFNTNITMFFHISIIAGNILIYRSDLG